MKTKMARQMNQNHNHIDRNNLEKSSWLQEPEKCKLKPHIPTEMAEKQKQQSWQAWRPTGALIAGGNIERITTWKCFLKSSTCTYHMTQQPTLSSFPKRIKIYVHTKTWAWFFLADLFKVATTSLNPYMWPQVNEWTWMCTSH